MIHCMRCHLLHGHASSSFLAWMAQMVVLPVTSEPESCHGKNSSAESRALARCESAPGARCFDIPNDIGVQVPACMGPYKLVGLDAQARWDDQKKVSVFGSVGGIGPGPARHRTFRLGVLTSPSPGALPSLDESTTLIRADGPMPPARSPSSARFH